MTKREAVVETILCAVLGLILLHVGTHLSHPFDQSWIKFVVLFFAGLFGFGVLAGLYQIFGVIEN